MRKGPSSELQHRLRGRAAPRRTQVIDAGADGHHIARQHLDLDVLTGTTSEL